MPRHQARPDLPVGRGLVGLRPLVAVPAPAHGMGAAAAIEEWLHDPASVAAYETQQKELGAKPSREKLMSTRPVPDPRKVRLRVYQTNSTHKSMSAIRQGSMVLVQGRRFRVSREPVPRGHLHPCLDQSEPAAHRQSRCRAAADGAGRLWPGDECHLDRPEDQVDRQCRTR